MSDLLSQLYVVLIDTVLPNLKRIQSSQADQRLLTDQLHQSSEQFRVEMAARFTEMRAELSATRRELDVALSTLRAIEEVRAGGLTNAGKASLIH